MKNEASYRTKWLTLRLTSEEHQKIKDLAARTVCPTTSEFVRRVLLQEPIHFFYRDQSLDEFLTDMAQLRVELGRLGNNFNQAVHRLHMLHNVPDIQQWLLLNESDKTQLFRHIETISNKLNDSYKLWSHALPSPGASIRSSDTTSKK